MTELPQTAIEHLHPFMVLAGVFGSGLVGIAVLVWKGAHMMERVHNRSIARAFQDDPESGEPGVAAKATRRIVGEAFTPAVEEVMRAVQDLDRKLEAHVRDEDGRNERRARELREELSRSVDQAMKFPAAVLRKVEKIEAVQEEQGKRIDSVEHRTRVLEQK